MKIDPEVARVIANAENVFVDAESGQYNHTEGATHGWEPIPMYWVAIAEQAIADAAEYNKVN